MSSHFTYHAPVYLRLLNEARANDPSVQGPPYFPPPPPPPVVITNEARASDQQYVKLYDCRIGFRFSKRDRQKMPPLETFEDKLKRLYDELNEQNTALSYLSQNAERLSPEDWNLKKRKMENQKEYIKNQLSVLNDTYLKYVNKILGRKMAKRQRLKRLKKRLQAERQELLKQWEEKSRKIDDKQQKIQDEIIKAKQEEQSKLQADAILKEVLRKKHDAKKYLTKLDGLIKLRRARLNTAKGRGVVLPKGPTKKFNEDIEKIHLLWTTKLAAYEKEEIQLREELNQDKATEEELTLNEKQKIVDKKLKKWTKFLFGSEMMPQFNFKGDFMNFVRVRSSWDRFIDESGTALPVGWVTPF